MFNRDRWLEIFDTISKNKLRTSLAGITVALGILIFVVLYGLGNGLENTFQKFFKDDQLNTIWINPGRTSKPYAGFESNRRIEFDNDDYADISDYVLYNEEDEDEEGIIPGDDVEPINMDEDEEKIERPKIEPREETVGSGLLARIKKELPTKVEEAKEDKTEEEEI